MCMLYNQKQIKEKVVKTKIVYNKYKGYSDNASKVFLRI